ncbi:methyltransferase [uncultured Shewanella sp.]|uniref:methyltransferase n=1 Tax=uncultured Shewanella sp. TaxID=173975 RepID=UPI00262A4E2D|nr:methyltransferase [uncultured Shewanella sp.]
MNLFEVVCLFLTLLIGISIIISTLRTGISPMPSSYRVRKAMLEQLDMTAQVSHVADLGSGWGHLGIAVAKAHPHIQVIGFEVSFFPWLVSVLWAKCEGLSNVTFKRQNFLLADLPVFQVYYCYLFPKGMQSLSRVLQQQKLAELTEGGSIVMPPRHLISNTFALPDHHPRSMTTMTDMYRTKVYTYHL